MIRLLFLIGVIFTAKTCAAQSIFAKYQVTAGPTMLSGILPVNLHIVYYVWADSNFIEIIGTEDSFSSDIPANFTQLKKNPSNEHIIINKSSGIGVFVNTNKYAIVKKAIISSNKKNGDCLLLAVNEGSSIKICEKINGLMTPGILFDNAEMYGVESFKSKNSTITLMSKISKSNRLLDYKKRFEGIEVNRIKDTVDFFKN